MSTTVAQPLLIRRYLTQSLHRLTKISPGSKTRRCYSSSPVSLLRNITPQDIEILKEMAPLETAKDVNLVSDWTRHYKNADSNVVVFPKSTKAVQSIVRYCHEHHIAIIPVSGNTGLVGGSMPVASAEQQNGVHLSLRHLNTIYSLQPQSGILHCQAGVILETLQEHAKKENYLLPIDLGAKGSCFIGGNIATNAGGQYYYRYGSIAANLVGLQVVTGSGNILNLGIDSNVLKDNTGYKLHQLFVGSEGTLGIITQVRMLCRPLLSQKETALVACTSFSNVLKVIERAKRCLGERLAAAEWMDGDVVKLVERTHNHLKVPQSQQTEPFSNYLLLETHGSQDTDKAALEAFVIKVYEEEWITDGTVAQDKTDQKLFWDIRETCNPAVTATGCTYKYDVSIPESDFRPFIEIMKERLNATDAIVSCWGHVLDGNLHFNVTTPGTFTVSQTMKDLLEPFVFEQVLQMGGSISAEHGIGQAKACYMSTIHDRESLAFMKDVKRLFDPHGIMNPGKVLPPSC